MDARKRKDRNLYYEIGVIEKENKGLKAAVLSLGITIADRDRNISNLKDVCDYRHNRIMNLCKLLNDARDEVGALKALTNPEEG